MSSTTIAVGEHFPAGTKVSVHPRVSDFAPAQHGKQVASSKVADDGSVKIDGLIAHGQYWLTGDVNDQTRNVAFDAPGDAVDLADEQAKRGDAQAQVRAEYPHLAAAAHGTLDVPEPDSWGPHPSVFEKSQEADPQPHVAQVDVPENTPQRSATPIGQATPVDPDEPQPKPAQADVPKGTPQRSDTELGEATPTGARGKKANAKAGTAKKRGRA